jgi:hypothetical protein
VPAFVGCAETCCAQEEKARCVGPLQFARLPPRAVVFGFGRPEGLPERAHGLQEGPVVEEADAVCEAREAQAFAQEECVEEEVVEPARVTHHVHDRAALLEALEPPDGRFVEPEMREEARREAAEEQVEARRHRRERIGFDPLHGRIRRRGDRRAGRIRHRR